MPLFTLAGLAAPAHAAGPVTLYAGSDCTGQSYYMSGWGFDPDIGFDAQSYYYA